MLVSVSTGAVADDGPNVASTTLLDPLVTWQEPEPVQPPPTQPVNIYPESGIAFRVTGVPGADVVKHAVPVGPLSLGPQSIDPDVLVTDPFWTSSAMASRGSSLCPGSAVTIAVH